jgi:OmpA-OmpF porin, OOP family
MKKLALLAALAAASLSTTAFAAEGNGGFIRAELGRSNVDVGVTDDSDTAFSIRGGYFFNSNIAIEGFYSNQYRADTGFGDEEAQLYTLGVGVVGKKNFGGDHKGFFISGRGGLAYTDIAYVEDGEVDIDEENDNSANLYLGVGVGYDFNERFGLSLNYDYQKAELNDTDFDVRTLTLGGEFRF